MSLCLIKYQAMKLYGGIEVYLHAFLASGPHAADERDRLVFFLVLFHYCTLYICTHLFIIRLYITATTLNTSSIASVVRITGS
jgi:hypothetical protein